MSDEAKGKGDLHRKPADWPADEPPPSAEELREAGELAEMVDQLLQGEASAAGEVQQTAVMIRAAVDDLGLEARRKAQLVEASLKQGLASGAGRPRRRRWMPLAAAATVLVAAAVMIVALSARPPARHAPLASPAMVLSRPSDALLGRPIKDKTAAARRLDLVFADRLNGYRQLRLAAGRTR